MAFAAHDLGSDSQFWRVRWAYDPCCAVVGRTRLCVSATEAWVRYDGNDWLGEPRVLDTAVVPLERIAPIELLGHSEVEMPDVQARTHQAAFQSRLRALQKAEQAFDIAEHAWATAGRELEPEPLTRALALWWTNDQLEALQSVRRGLENMGPWMETWEEALDNERAALCRQILGIRVGDSVSVAIHQGRTRLRLEGVRLVFREDDGELEFLLYGARYRKDGLPGKRAECVTVSVPWARR